MVATSLALLYLVALFHVEVGDAAHRGGADVHIGLGLDLAGAADDRGQILLHELCGQHLGVAGLLLEDHEGHKPGSHNNGKNNQKNFFHLRWLLQVFSQSSVRNVYAIGSQFQNRIDRPAFVREFASNRVCRTRSEPEIKQLTGLSCRHSVRPIRCDC